MGAIALAWRMRESIAPMGRSYENRGRSESLLDDLYRLHRPRRLHLTCRQQPVEH